KHFATRPLALAAVLRVRKTQLLHPNRLRHIATLANQLRDRRLVQTVLKESISAVESLAIKVTGDKKGTLGQLLKKLEDKVQLHPALKNAFSSLYGYTSDESGVRHALTESGKVDFNDAKFMLVVCSAFVGFIEGKRST
ncbi:MAG TPA: hypothetical protein VGM96_30885, partial [Reyranella sp.]